MKSITNRAGILAGLGLASLLAGCGRPEPRIVEFVSTRSFTLSQLAVLPRYQSGPANLLPLYVVTDTAVTIECTDGSDSTELFLLIIDDTMGEWIRLRSAGPLLYVNGKVKSISADEDTLEQFSEWVASSDAEELKQVQSVIIDWPYVQEGAAVPASVDVAGRALETVIRANPSVCVFTEGLKQAPKRPLLLFLEISDADVVEALRNADLSQLRILYCFPDNQDLLSVLAGKPMPRLVNFIGDNPAAVLPPSALGRLRGSIVGSNPSPHDFAIFKSLQELAIGAKNPDLVVDFSQLPHPDRLRSLKVHGKWANLRGYEKLTQLEHLMPGEITDDELAAALPSFPKLKYLSLSVATLHTLEPLRQAKSLEVLALCEPAEGVEYDLSPLQELPRLRYVATTEDWRKNEVLMQRLREACPGVVYYEEQYHFKGCLGAGWLVLFLPALALVLWLKRRQA